jgi:hypothetical protein
MTEYVQNVTINLETMEGSKSNISELRLFWELHFKEYWGKFRFARCSQN